MKYLILTSSILLLLSCYSQNEKISFNKDSVNYKYGISVVAGVSKLISYNAVFPVFPPYGRYSFIRFYSESSLDFKRIKERYSLGFRTTYSRVGSKLAMWEEQNGKNTILTVATDFSYYVGAFFLFDYNIRKFSFISEYGVAFLTQRKRTSESSTGEIFVNNYRHALSSSLIKPNARRLMIQLKLGFSYRIKGFTNSELHLGFVSSVSVYPMFNTNSLILNYYFKKY